MRTDSTKPERSVVLATTSVPGAGPAPGAAVPAATGADGAAVLPRLVPRPRRLTLPWARPTFGPRAARLALATLVLGALGVMVFATASASALVPSSSLSFPGWEAGPLHSLFGHVSVRASAVQIGFSGVLLAMTGAYAVVLLAARNLSMRLIAACIVALHVVLLLGPPLQLTDLFNYLGYGRLGAIHGLNPYVHGIGTALHDPIYRFASWHHLHSPYGPLFTAISYPVALLPIPVAYWVLKVLPVLLSLVFIALVYKCARLLGRDPRFAVLFVAANPIYLMYAVAGFHNDFFMLVPSTAAVALLLAQRDRSAGAAVMVAVAVKFSAGLLLPFLWLGARMKRRRINLLVGCALAAVPLVAMSLALFGPHLPNLRDQSTLLTDFSVPNIAGLLIGAGGGAPWLLRIANVALVVAVALLLRRRGHWLASAGWGTLALLCSLAWLVPWYVIWLLPLAGLASSVRLRKVALAFTVFLVLTFMPATSMLLHTLRIDPLGGSAGQASQNLQHKLSQ